ncbi:MFS transporter [Cupriavidus sp. NPDC089707]|uniref:MFS transporter n=1 Tax=Cupriavidus sp. NPDC089707 TaxID=3363963 RepID=UPI0038182B8F
MTLQHTETQGLPKPLLGLVAVGFLVPGATILQTLTITWFLAQLTEITSLLPLVIGGGAVARIFSGIPFNGLIQRMGARNACMLSLLAGAAILLGTIAVLARLLPLWLLILSEIGLGTAVTGFSISRQILIKDLLHGERENLAAGLSRSAGYLSKLVVPLFGGLLLIALKPAYATLVSCGILLVSAWVIWSLDMSPPSGSADQKALPLTERIAVAVAFYKRDHTLVFALGFTAILNFVLSPLVVIMPLFVAAIDGANSAYLGFSESCLGAGAVGGALSYAKLRRCHLPSLAVMTGFGFLLICVSAELPSAWRYPGLNIALLVIGASVAFSGSAADALLMTRVPRDSYGRLLGVQALIVGSAFPTGLFAAGVLLQLTDAFLVIAAYNAGLCMAVALLLHLKLGKSGVQPNLLN